MTSSNTPISIAHVALTVNNLDLMAEFYERVIGLHPISRDGETAWLGTDTTSLIELRQDRTARRRPQEAGLFHTAFLLPERNDLSRWLRHVADMGIRLDGAADHLVSEALYVTDPEGNGVEVYRDRPSDTWSRRNDEIEMATLALDLDEVARSAEGRWSGVPADTCVGHVHLQVGDIGIADNFLSSTLGLTRTFGLPSAGWYGSGGYHHHLAANIWNSRGAGPRSPGTTGLAEVGLLATPDTLSAGTLSDPWGNQFTIAPAHHQASDLAS